MLWAAEDGSRYVWIPIATQGEAPSPRFHHTCECFNGALLQTSPFFWAWSHTSMLEPAGAPGSQTMVATPPQHASHASVLATMSSAPAL